MFFAVGFCNRFRSEFFGKICLKASTTVQIPVHGPQQILPVHGSVPGLDKTLQRQGFSWIWLGFSWTWPGFVPCLTWAWWRSVPSGDGRCWRVVLKTQRWTEVEPAERTPTEPAPSGEPAPPMGRSGNWRCLRNRHAFNPSFYKTYSGYLLKKLMVITTFPTMLFTQTQMSIFLLFLNHFLPQLFLHIGF